MSHFVKVRTRISERSHLLDALRQLGLSFDAGEKLEVRGDRAKPEQAEIVIHLAPGTDIGFRKIGETYEIVADWYRVEQRTPIRKKNFLEELNRSYACHVIRDQAREQNLIVQEETLENGDVVIVLSERE